MDIGAACTAFVTALSVGTSLIESGRAETVLVIGADALSRFTDFDDKRTAALFGDGAGAVVLGNQEAAAASARSCSAPTPSSPRRSSPAARTRYLRMDGHTTFNAATAALDQLHARGVELAGLALDDVDLFVYHQANARITKAVAEKLELPMERVADYIADIGNTSAASIPLALAFAREEDRLHPGDTVLVAAVGAGFTWGGARPGVGRPRMSQKPRPDERRRPRHRCLQGHRRRGRHRAGRGRLERRRQLPLRQGGRREDRQGDRGGGRQGASPSRATSPTPTASPTR